MDALGGLTLTLTPEVDGQLGGLANRTSTSRSSLAERAVSDFVERELAILAGIERGLADMRAGRVVDHEDATDELDRIIDRVAARRG